MSYLFRKTLMLITLSIFFIKTGNSQESYKIEDVAPGVRKITMGIPDKFTPYSFCKEKPIVTALEILPKCEIPSYIKDIKIKITERCNFRIISFVFIHSVK